MNLAGQLELLKKASGIEVVFAGLVNNTNEVVRFGIAVFQDSVKLSRLERGE